MKHILIIIGILLSGMIHSQNMNIQETNGTLITIPVSVIDSAYIIPANTPTIITTQITSITQITAISGGNIIDDAGASVISRGVCWSTSSNPVVAGNHTTDGSGTGSFASNITGLTINTLYHVRAYFTNSYGTYYGNQINFTTQGIPNCGTLTDIDGNLYNTVIIGTQCWMGKNLKVTKYMDGSNITKIMADNTWSTLTYGAYCDYDNTVSNSTIYGKLYNFYAVSNSHGLCPTGWHVPSHDEWTELERALCTSATCGTDFPYDTISQGFRGTNEGSKLKEVGSAHWLAPNTGATNSSGFCALPGSCRLDDGSFGGSYEEGRWWSLTTYNGTHAWGRYLMYSNSQVGRGNYYKKYGFSVRCVKD